MAGVIVTFKRTDLIKKLKTRLAAIELEIARYKVQKAKAEKAIDAWDKKADALVLRKGGRYQRTTYSNSVTVSLSLSNAALEKEIGKRPMLPETPEFLNMQTLRTMDGKTKYTYGLQEIKSALSLFELSNQETIRVSSLVGWLVAL